MEVLAKLLSDTKAPLQARKNSSSALFYSAQKGIKLSSNVLFTLKGALLDKDSFIQNNSINALSLAIKDGYKVDDKTIFNIGNLLATKDVSESVSNFLLSVSSQKYDLSATIINDLVKILDDRSYKISVHINSTAILKNIARNGQILDANTISVLKKQLNNNNPEIKYHSAYALAYCTKYSTEILDTLERYLLDKDVSISASYAFRKYIKQTLDIPNSVVKKLTTLLLPNYNNATRNNAICIIRNLAEGSYMLPKNTLHVLEKAIIDESLYVKNNAISALGYAAHNGYYIASHEIVELFEKALNDITTYDSSKLALRYIKNSEVIVNDKEHTSPNPSSNIYQHLKAPTGNIKTELQKTIVQEDNQSARTKEKSQEQNLTLTSLEEALAGKSGNTEQGHITENLPGKILEGDHKAWYRQTRGEINNLLNLAKNKTLLTEIDLKYLSDKIFGIGWRLYVPIKGTNISDIALAFKYAAENGQILPEEGINNLVIGLEDKDLRSRFRSFLHLQVGVGKDIEEFKKNATAALSYTARNRQELSPEAISALEKLTFHDDPEVRNNAVNALSYVAQYSRKSISLEKLEKALLDKKTSIEISFVFLKKTKEEKEIISEQALINLGEVLSGDYEIKARENSSLAIANAAKNGQKVPDSLVKKLLESVDDYCKEIRNNAIYALSFIARNGQILPEDMLPKLENDLLNKETALSAMYIFEKAMHNKQDIHYKVFDTLSEVVISNLDFQLRNKAIEVLGYRVSDNREFSENILSNLERALNDPEIAIKDNAALLYNASLNIAVTQSDKLSDNQINTILRLCSRDFSPEVRINTIFTFCNMARNGHELSEEGLSILEYAVLSKDIELAKYSIESLDRYTKYKIALPKSTISVLERSLDNKELRDYSLPVIKRIVSNNQELSEYTLQTLSKFLYTPCQEELYGNALSILEIADTNIELPSDVENILELEQYGNIIKKTSDNKYIRNAIKQLRDSANKGNKLSENNLEIITDLLTHEDDNINHSSIYTLSYVAKNGQKLSAKAINEIGKLLVESSFDKNIVCKTLGYIVKNGQILPQDIIKTLEKLVLDYSVNEHVISIFKMFSNRGMKINNSVLQDANYLIVKENSKIQTKRDAISLFASAIQNDQSFNIAYSWVALNVALKDSDEIMTKSAVSFCKLISQKKNKLPDQILEQLVNLAEKHNKDISHYAIEALETAATIQTLPKDIYGNFELIKSRQILSITSASNTEARYDALKKLDNAVKNGQKLLGSNFTDLELMLGEPEEKLRILAAKILNTSIKNNDNLPVTTIESIAGTLNDSAINVYTSEILLKVAKYNKELASDIEEKLGSLLINEQTLAVRKNALDTLKYLKTNQCLSNKTSKAILDVLDLENISNELTKWFSIKSSELMNPYDGYKPINEAIKKLSNAIENNQLLPVNALLSLGDVLTDIKVRQSALEVILSAVKRGQRLPQILVDNLEVTLLKNNKAEQKTIVKILTHVIRNEQVLQNSSIEVLESLLAQGNSYVIPAIKHLVQNKSQLLRNETLKKLGDILLNSDKYEVRYDAALIIRSVAQKQFLPEGVVYALSKVLYDNTDPDIQKSAFSSLRYCIQNGQDCGSVMNDMIISSLATLSQEVGSEILKSKLENVPFEVMLSILDTVLSREYLDTQIIKNSPVESWIRNLLCSDLLDQTSAKQEVEIYKFFENLAKLEEYNSYDKYDEDRDNILQLLIEKRNSYDLSLPQINETLVLLRIGHKNALELLDSSNTDWDKHLKEEWLKTRLSKRFIPTDIQNISCLLEQDQIHWSLEFTDKFLETKIDNTKQLINFLALVKEYNISESDLNELSKNLHINNLNDWKFHIEYNILKNQLTSNWQGSRELLSRAKERINEMLQNGWSFNSIKQILSKFENKEAVKSKQDLCEYFVESLNIINSYKIRYDSKNIEGLNVDEIFEKYQYQEWVQRLHNLAISINFESEGNERNLDNLLQEIGKNNKAINSLLNNNELSKQFNEVLAAYDRPSSLGISSIIHNSILNPDFDQPIKDWSKAHIEMWASLVSKSEEARNERFLPEMVAVIKHAMLLHSKHEARTIQILAVLIMLNSRENGRLAQIATGEGKSTTVAMLAVIKALQGKQTAEKVDVITSSPLLAKRDAEEQSGFYSMFGLTVGDNGDEMPYSSGSKDCYTKDIVYGDSSNFQFDVLRDEYSFLGTRAGRNFGSVIIDEVDSMLIDESAKIARLANSMPGMEYLEPLLTAIWHELDRLNKRFVKLEGKLHWVGQDFKVENGVVKIKGNEDGDNALLPVDDPYEFTKKHIIDNYINPLISEKENHIPENLKLRIPQHLRSFVVNQLPKWVDNAILAKTEYKEGHHYLINQDENKIERITPVDFSSTGIIQNSTTWSDGLHQFLQIKHGLKITPESLTTNFLSNMGYFRRYENKVYGLTGTLGSQDSQELLSKIYPVDVVKIPSYKEKQFLELPGIVAKHEQEWLERTLNNVIGEAKKNRAVLIICETINQAEQIYKGLDKNYISNRVKLYTRNDNDEQKAVSHQIDAGEIIVATNLAGRGTDIKTSQVVEDNGGLHVCVTFLPSNLRVEEQAFGRTARQGKRGTAILIIDEHKTKEQLNSLYPEYLHKESNDIAIIKDWRNKAESARLQKVKETEIEEIGRKDELFRRFCVLFKDLKNIEDDQYKLSAVEERWGLWLKNIDNENQDIITKSIYEQFDDFSAQLLKEYKENRVIKNPYYYIAKTDSLIDEANSAGTGFKKVMTNIFTLGIAKTGREELREQAIENLTAAIELDPIFSFAAYVSRAYLYLEQKPSGYKQKARLDLITAQKSISSYIIPQLQNMTLSSNVGNIEMNENKKESFSKQIIIKLDILNIYLSHIQQALSVIEESQKLIDISFDDKGKQETFTRLTKEEVNDQIANKDNSNKKIKLSFHDLKVDGDMVSRDQAINTVDKANKGYNGISIEWKNLTQDKAKELVNKSSQPMNINLSNITPDEAIKLIKNTKINKISLSFNRLKSYESIIEIVKSDNIKESVLLGRSNFQQNTNTNLRIDKEDLIEKVQYIQEQAKKKITDIEESQKLIDSNFDDKKIQDTLKNLTEDEQHDITLENLNYEDAIKIITEVQENLQSLPLSLIFNNMEQSKTLEVISLRDSLTVSFNNLNPIQARDIIKNTDQRNFVLSFGNLDSDGANYIIKEADRNQQDIKVSLKPLEESFLKTEKPTEELRELYTHGVHKLITLQENNPIPWWSIATVAGLGLAQIIGGACLVVFTAGFGSTVGFGLITEGISDLFAAASGIYNRDFSWKDYAIQKAVSMTICLATAGLSALKNAAKAAKKVGEVAIDVGTKVANTVKKGAEKVVVAVQGLTTKTFKQVGVHVAVTVAETGAKKVLNYGVDQVSSAVLEKVKSAISEGVERSMLENFKEKKCSNITKKALAVDKYSKIDIWKSRIEQSGFKIVNPNKNEYIEASKSLVKGLLQGAMAQVGDKGTFGKTFELSSMALNSTRALAELPLVISNFHSSFLKELEQIDQKLPSINDLLIQKYKDVTPEEAIVITDSLKEQDLIQEDGILNALLIQNKESFTSGISTNYNNRKFNSTIQKYEYTNIKESIVNINDIKLGEHQKHKDKVISVCTEFNKCLVADYSFTTNMMHKKLIDLVTNQIIQLIQGELISPWTNYGVNGLVECASEKIQRYCADGNTVKELINQTKSKIEILEIANEMIDNNMEKGTGIIGDDPDKFVDRIVANVINSGEAGLLELGALAAITGVSIEVLQDISKQSKENTSKIEIGFEEGINEKSGHYTNGKEVKSSGKNNCLYDAIAQKVGLNGQELRQKVASHIKNNSYFYLKMQPAVEYILKTSYGNPVKAKNLLMMGGDKEDFLREARKLIEEANKKLKYGAGNWSANPNKNEAEKRISWKRKIVNAVINELVNQFNSFKQYKFLAPIIKTLEMTNDKKLEISANFALKSKAGNCGERADICYSILKQVCPENVKIEKIVIGDLMCNGRPDNHAFVVISPIDAKSNSESIVVDLWTGEVVDWKDYKYANCKIQSRYRTTGSQPKQDGGSTSFDNLKPTKITESNFTKLQTSNINIISNNIANNLSQNNNTLAEPSSPIASD